jgi:hypothetical protein
MGLRISLHQSLLARGHDQRPGIERIMGQTVDISEWLDFDFMIDFMIEFGIGMSQKRI